MLTVRNLSIPLLALACFVLAACGTVAAPPPPPNPTPEPMMRVDATPTSEKMMSEDSGMGKDGMMASPAATPSTVKDGDGMSNNGMSETGAMMAPTERYVAYSSGALADATRNGRAVLFFRAEWCPTCRVADAEFRANLDRIPTDVTVFRVDYDDAAALKQKYTVTYQHTFVQVDAEGNAVTRWNGGGLEDLLANVQ